MSFFSIATRLNPNWDKCSDEIARIGTSFAFQSLVTKLENILQNLDLVQSMRFFFGRGPHRDKPVGSRKVAQPMELDAVNSECLRCSKNRVAIA